MSKMADHNGTGVEDMAVIAAAAEARSLRREKTTATGSAAPQVSEAYACSMIADLLNSTHEEERPPFSLEQLVPPSLRSSVEKDYPSADAQHSAASHYAKSARKSSKSTSPIERIEVSVQHKKSPPTAVQRCTAPQVTATALQPMNSPAGSESSGVSSGQDTDVTAQSKEPTAEQRSAVSDAQQMAVDAALQRTSPRPTISLPVAKKLSSPKPKPGRHSSGSSRRGAASRVSDASMKSLMGELPQQQSPRVKVTLLEQIVRSHPIWYLQHLGRAATSHLLRPMPPGTFIVRASSRSNAMALSVRLPDAFGVDIDHYLVEKHGSNVRLEGSPNSFKSLPMLIEHYCHHGEELQTKLCLPPAISACTTTLSLQRLALMGQDFWTSEVSRMDAAGRMAPMIMHNPMSTLDKQRSSPLLVDKMSASMCSAASDSSGSFDRYRGGHYQQHSAATSQQRQVPLRHSRLGVSSEGLAGGAAEAAAPHAALLQSDYRYQPHAPPPYATRNDHVPLKKSQSAYEDIRTSSAASFDAHGMPRLDSGANSVSSASTKSSRRRSGSNFLRNLFSSGSGGSGSGTKAMKPVVQLDARQQQNQNGLAECQYFMPYADKQISSSQSDASIFASTPGGFRMFSRPSRRETVEKPAVSNGFHPRGAVSATRAPHDGPAPSSPLSKNRHISASTASLRKGFTSCLKTFHPGSSISGGGNTKDDMATKRMSNDAILARQMAYRREQTDLGSSSVHRLAAHRAEDESPSAPQLRRPLFADTKRAEAARQNRHQKIHANGNGNLPPPLVPPQGRGQMDETAMQKCIEELRRRRTESCSAAETSEHSGTPPEAHHRQQAMPKSDRPPWRREHDEKSSAYEVILRSRQEPFRRESNRLSVPNLVDSNADTSRSAESIANTVRALTAKLGRSPGTGELQTINEGLITPVIRRKQFGGAATAAAMTAAAAEAEDAVLSQQQLHHYGPASDDGRALIQHKRTISDQTSSTGAHRHYQHFPAAFASDSDPHEAAANAGFKRPLAASRSISSGNASAAVANWSAVSSELKSRQRVAKVRPQPQQHNISPSTVIGRETEGRSSAKTPKTSKKQSEYAQLSDLFEGQEGDKNTSVRSWKSAGHSFVDMNNSDFSCRGASDDDAVSVAGTVFNEPWDSNVWENLLDLAQFGDERPTAASARIGASYMHIDDRISEEESSPSCSTESSSNASTGHHEDSDVALDVAYAQRCGDAAESASHHGLDLENQENIEASMTAPDQENYDVFEDDASHILSVSGNKIWSEISQQIPSQPSTYDSRRGKSNSLINVGAAATASGDMMMTSGSGKDSLKRRAQTPNVASSAHLNNSIDDLPITIPQLSPVISPPRLRNAHKNSDPGVRIQKYVESIGADETTVFGATLQRFIECTVEAEESDPYVVIRNVRQFLNGIKNYLVKHGEGDLHFLIERESAKLNANEFLNIDAILEAVLHKILLVPVKPHLYHLMVRENSRSGALQSLSENLAHVRGMKPEQLGFPDGTRMPEPRQMEQIRLCLRKMQHHYSPLKKLENLLRALSNVVSRPAPAPVGKRHPSSGDLSGAFGGKSKKLPPADELIRWLVYLLARTSSVGCEVEAWYMWELLPQQLLTTGDAAYYLSTLFSAIHVLKHPDSLRRLKNIPDNVACMGPQMPRANGNSEETSDAFIRIAVPDEQAGSIEYHTFPAVSQMNAAKLCRVIAHQFAITNPEDYGLYILFDGFETCLLANECPDVVRDQLSEAGKSYLFAYKRHDAKIAWPKNIVQASVNNAPPHQAAAALAGDHHLV